MFSMKRLERAKIHTINKFKINEAGRIDTVCFDKTGTLTEEFPKTFAYGINSVSYSVEFSKPYDQLIFPPINKRIMKRKRRNVKKKKSASKMNSLSPDILENSRIRKTKSSIRKMTMGKEDQIAKRLTNRLSFMGNVYNLDNDHKNSSLMPGSSSMFTFLNKMSTDNPFKTHEMNMSNGKGSIKDFCDNVGHIIEDIKVNRMAIKYLECMSFCHTLINIDDTYIGDPLEVEMVSNSPFNCRYVSNVNNSSFKKIYIPKSKI
jgi:magnesium-transporting ATPase (P-type)